MLDQHEVSRAGGLSEEDVRRICPAGVHITENMRTLRHHLNRSLLRMDV
jgi:hypothetical protein